MITRLYLDNCFRHKGRTFTFEKGITGIIGPNESGKSLIVEMIRYALFGSAALRGKGDDYKKLHVELDFTVAGTGYTVIRKGSKAELAGGRLASGTKPVNTAIREILGYDLTVFDVANACNQGNVEALSSMRPAERKAMVDQVVGLSQLDTLITFAGQEGNALKREAEAMARGLYQPVEPEKVETSVTGEIVAQKEADAAEFQQLQGFLSQAPERPVAPEPRTFPEGLEQQLEAREEALQLQRKMVRQLSKLEPEAHSPKELDEFEAWMDQADAWKRKEKLLAQGHHECPKCSHQWPVADLGALADVEETKAPSMTRRELADHRARIGNTDQIAMIQRGLDEIEIPEDVSSQLTEKQRYEAAVAAYERSLEAYETYNADLPQKRARFEELQGVVEELTTLREELALARQYERDLQRYHRDLEAYAEKSTEVTRLANRSEEFLAAREAIKALKVQVKGHLLPSLNKVASVLLSQMTGGERRRVEVDEDFEITIDGQAIGTLSGSGKAVANLALRIALGQILTNRVFSFFAADEVDAAMDDERAAYTADALRRLTDTVGQVVLVTHKRPETDHMVELTK